MKQFRSTLIIGLVVIALVALGASSAVAADPPQPWMYAAIQSSGLGTVEAVQASFIRYQNGQALLHQYDTPGKWKAAYESDVSNWLRAHGCASCYIDNNLMSFKLRIDAPIYMFDAGASAVPY